jgi:hypothetical protein
VQTLNPAMSETQNDPEDLLIRNILVTAAVGAVATLIGLVLVVTAMISANWNFMDWME